MKKFLALFLVFLALTRGSVSAAELKWRKYENGRFGYVLTYPSQLVAGRESTNGGGRELHTADGEFSLAVSAHFFVADTDDSFEKRWQEELTLPGVSITYKKKTATWYAISGATKDGTEYYHKLYTKGSNWAGFQITYPHALNKKYDPWVAAIEKRFVAFRAGDFDRIE